jgi:DNA-binding CsgD family transcriptional regulator/tetratricopeptide (TPR) repeat protein
MSQTASRPPALPGRGPECAALVDLVTGDDPSPVTLLSGEAGIGKTTLLGWAQDLARLHGMRTLTAVGLPTESDLPFSGLEQLLRPALDEPGSAPDRRRAVESALSAPDAAGHAVFRTGSMVLGLLADLSPKSGLLVAVDDVQWMDRPTRDVLAFVARRLVGEPVRMVIAARGEPPPALAEAARDDGWRSVEVGRLDEAAAVEVLGRSAPDLSDDLQRRVLDAATGNPLALSELPTSALDAPAAAARVPVSDRLEAVFAARYDALPETSQRLVLLAAAHDSDDLAELLLAGRILVGDIVTPSDLEPAVDCGLLRVEPHRVRFGHPLARSGVYRRAGVAARRVAHRALAQAAHSADRRAWHLAAAADGPDEDAALQLDAAARRAGAAGAIEIAARAYEEAARVSANRAVGASRLLRAAEMAEEIGQRDRALDLLGRLDTAALDEAERARLDWLREVFTDEAWTGGDRIATFLDIARRMHAAGDTDRGMSLLSAISLRCWWSNVDARTRLAIAAVADDLAAAIGDPEHVVVTALGAPVERGAAALEAVRRTAAADLYPDSTLLLELGLAATAVGDHSQGVKFFSATVAEAGRQGRTTTVCQALVGAAWAEVHLGRLRRGEVAAEEGIALATETVQPLWVATGELALAAARGLRGEIAAATALADRGERVFLEAGANPMLAQVRAARGLAALGAGQYDEAFTQLRRVFETRDVSYHEHFRTFLVAELAEAAVHGGQRDAARAHMDELSARWNRTRSPILGAGLLVARPLLAPDDEAEKYFQDALEDGLVDWPLHRGRVHLEYGVWLRRQRRSGEAREPLRVAHETFSGLGATPWADRAARELRAAGDVPGERPPAAWQNLTFQELQIANLAAEGLTNRQIGERLFLSHRTVGSHLYHIYPKLGIASRGHLRAALSELRGPSGAE